MATEPPELSSQLPPTLELSITYVNNLRERGCQGMCQQEAGGGTVATVAEPAAAHSALLEAVRSRLL